MIKIASMLVFFWTQCVFCMENIDEWSFRDTTESFTNKKNAVCLNKLAGYLNNEEKPNSDVRTVIAFSYLVALLHNSQEKDRENYYCTFVKCFIDVGAAASRCPDPTIKSIIDKLKPAEWYYTAKVFSYSCFGTGSPLLYFKDKVWEDRKNIKDVCDNLKAAIGSNYSGDVDFAEILKQKTPLEYIDCVKITYKAACEVLDEMEKTELLQ
jgi:hypothetical protein